MNHDQSKGKRIKRIHEVLRSYRKRLVFVLLLTIVLVPYLFSRIVAPSARIRVLVEEGIPQDVFDGTLSIVSFNIAHGRGPVDGNWADCGAAKRKRVEEIGNFLRDLDADMVVLNEVDFCSTWSGHQNQSAAIAKTAGYRYRVEQRNLDFRFAYGSWKFGNVILSKFPLSNAQQIDFPPERVWEDWLVGCKRGVVCDVALDVDNSIRLAAVHLEHRSESIRFASAKKLIELYDATGPPLIVAGDFNSTPIQFPHSSVSPAGNNAMENVIASGRFQYQPMAAPGRSELTFSSTDPRSVIDWILISASSADNSVESRFLEYDVIESELSDHLPVQAMIEFEMNPIRIGR